MSALWFLFILLHILSIAFVVVSIKRLHTYIDRFHFDESKYTLLFGFIHINLIVIFYFFMMMGWIGLSLMIFNRV